MSFFNKKEEVIYFKLTPYGRHLLSMGKFRPKYYAFFDDNILYAPEYANFVQKQNDVEGRIQDDTPYTRAQHSYSGVERNLNSVRRNCMTGQSEPYFCALNYQARLVIQLDLLLHLKYHN